MKNWTIDGLSGVGKVELSLDDSKRTFVFLGSNGVGKTKTLEALFVYFLAKNKDFQPRPSTEYSLEPNFSSIQRNDQKISFVDFVVDWAKFSDQIKPLGSFSLAYLGAADRINIKEASFGNQSIGSFKERQQTHFNKILNLFNNKKSLTNVGMSENLHDWFITRAQSDNPYQEKNDNRKVEIDAVLEVLHAIDKSIDNKFLRIKGSGAVFLSINNEIIELGELSSGFISILKMIQAIISAYAAFTNEVNLLRVRGVVLIDEIESHLHVGWQTKIIPTLKKLFPNTTFYITTHSPLVLSQLDEGEAYLLKRDPDDGVVRSEVIIAPSNRILEDVMADAFDIDLNRLKLDALATTGQSAAKKELLALLNSDTED